MSVDFTVTLTISALRAVGIDLAGHTTQLNGGAGNLAPAPVATTIVVPDVDGDGAVATVLAAKFLWLSNEKLIL